MITISYATPPQEVWIEWSHTQSSLGEDPFTQSLAPGFDAFGAQIKLFHTQELDLIRNVVAARVRVGRADILLDKIFDEIVLHLLAYVSNDRNHPEYVRFIGTKKPSDIKRPVLGSQFSFMEDFPSKLKTAKTQVLRDYESKVAAILGDAQTAMAQLRAAELALSSFYKTGSYISFIDSFNGARKALHGQIADIGHQHPEANLGTDYAEGFFLRARRSEGPTIAGEQQKVEQLKSELARHEQILAEMLADLDAQQVARLHAEEQVLLEEQKRLQAEMAELQQKAAEKQAKLDALAAELGKNKP